MIQSLKLHCANSLGARLPGNLAALEKGLGEEGWSPFSTRALTRSRSTPQPEIGQVGSNSSDRSAAETHCSSQTSKV